MITIRHVSIAAAGLGLLLLGSAFAVAQQFAGNGNTELLQRRLTDAGCYHGPINGQNNADLQTAIKACPSQDPVLLIETGMHVAPVKRIGVDRACRVAATGSYDKTVRLWSLPDGRLLRTMRVAIGPGDGGKIYATAVSPDGRWIAAGGWDAQWDLSQQDFVYIFDATTGGMVARAGPFDSVINHLAFSPDGRWLAAASSKNVGLKVIDVQNWRIVATDKDYDDDSYGLTFAPDGRIFTVAYDGKIRRYSPGPSFKKERETKTHGSAEPYSIAVDPRGQMVAVGFSDKTTVDVYDASTLQFRFAADTKEFDNGNLSKVAWSGDGSRLFAGGSYEAKFSDIWKSPMVTFDRDGKRVGSPLPLTDDAILNLLPCGDAIALAAADPAFGLVDRNNQSQLLKKGVAPDMRDKIGDAFTVAPDAKQVRFGLGDRGDDPVVFDLEHATLKPAPDPVPSFNAPQTKGLPVANWTNTYSPTFAGKPITLEQYETSRSLAIRPDRSGFVLGTEYLLRAYNDQGHESWEQAGPSIFWGVNFSADGRIIVASLGDGTVRWYRWSDGHELLAVFVDRATRAWVAWTPSGYYMASPGGEDLIGWHVNRGWNQLADFFPVSKFRNQYARSDIVQQVLKTLDEAQAVNRANAASPSKTPTRPIIESLPPVLSILTPSDNSQVNGPSVTIEYLVRSPSGIPIDAIETLINGQPAGGRSTGDDAKMKQCISETHGLGRTDGALQGCRGALTVQLAPGTTEISIDARAAGITSNIATTHVTR